MELSRSRKVAPSFAWAAEVGSTNDELVARAETEPHFSVLATDNQTAGRGRLGRTWVAPPGKSLAVSILVRPSETGAELAQQNLGWLPLLAGTAMARAIAPVVPEAETTVKWPNDVLINDRKACGILTELVSDGAVVVGAGLNLSLDAGELPVPTATSLLLAGAEGDAEYLADLCLSRYLAEFRDLVTVFLEHNGDVEKSGIRSTVSAACSTIGAEVRIELPGGSTLEGLAERLDEDGRLVIRSKTDGSLQAVAAGDVTHLRYE